MAKAKTFALRLTKTQLETVQHLLEQAAAGASPDQMKALEGIDTQIYRLLFPSLVDKGQHPFSLENLRNR
jgi:hypothetical protein